MSKTGFSSPKLADYNGDLTKEWYVGFRHTCEKCGIRKPYQVRLGINYARTVPERLAEGRAVEKLLLKALKSGWNPHHEKYEDFITAEVTPVNSLELMTLPQALDFALEKKKASVAPKSYLCFKSSVKYLKQSIPNADLSGYSMSEIKRRHIKLLLEQLGKDRQKAYDAEGAGKKWTGNAYNKHKRYLSLLFTELVEYEAIEYNPCTKISDKPEIKTNKHRHATIREEQTIKDHLKKVQPDFFRYLAFETLLGIRPKEIFGLKIADYDMFNQCFDLGTDGKTHTARKVPIPDTLLKYIEEIGIENYQPDSYLFSEDFKPGAKRKSRDYATKLWAKLVRKDLGLDVSLYSFKGLGGEKKRQVGIDLITVSQGSFGHATTDMSQKHYLPTEQERQRQEIIKRTPDF